MVEPKDLEIKKWAYNKTIDSIKVDYVLHDTDQTTTYVILKDTDNGTKRMLESTFRYYFDLKLDHCSIAKLKDVYTKEVEDWIKFSKRNKRDIAEYKRLQKKLFGDTNELKESN